MAKIQVMKGRVNISDQIDPDGWCYARGGAYVSASVADELLAMLDKAAGVLERCRYSELPMAAKCRAAIDDAMKSGS